MKKNINSQIADLYAYAGIKGEYSEGAVQRYGQEVVDAAIKLVPEVKVFEQGIVALMNQLSKNPTGKLYAEMLERHALYGGENYNHHRDLLDVIAVIAHEHKVKL